MNDLTSLDNKSLWELHSQTEDLMTNYPYGGDLLPMRNMEQRIADIEAEMLNRGFQTKDSFRDTSSAFYYGHHATLEEYKQFLESCQ